MHSTLIDRYHQLYQILLLKGVNGVGTNRFHQMVDYFGSPEDVLNKTSKELAEIPGIGKGTSEAIVNKKNQKKAQDTVDKIKKLGWNFFLYSDPDYPKLLSHLVDRPPCLFYLGTFLPEDNNAIAIVGSRTASEEGRWFAISLAEELARNKITVVSGMARGIDTCAHKGAMQNNGRTIAVFGASLDIIYPPENRKIAAQIAENGCLISEYVPGTDPFAANFTNRNRIISGLSQGVVIVEAASRSGALSTAAHALRQNREVFAVPGSPKKSTAAGTNKLIKQGAKLLTGLKDIFDELPRLKSSMIINQARNVENLTVTEKEIISLFTDGPVHLDSLSRSMNQPVNELMPILLALELKGVIKELAGKRFILD